MKLIKSSTFDFVFYDNPGFRQNENQIIHYMPEHVGWEEWMYCLASYIKSD